MIPEQTYRNVAKMIKKENPNWANIDEGILILLLKIACSRFKSSDFNGYKEEELMIRIRNAFNHSPEARSITPEKIEKLNAAYRMGKAKGMNIRRFANKILSFVKVGSKNDEGANPE